MEKYEHVHRASPQIYTIDAPRELTRLPHYTGLNNWGWINLSEMFPSCDNAHRLACERLGNPKIPIPWVVEEESLLGLINCFGLLMDGNGERANTVHYTYVRCHRMIKPKAGDFYLESTIPPSREDCRTRCIYVPAGWTIKVLDLIRKGINRISLDNPTNVRMAHLHDGTITSFSSVK